MDENVYLTKEGYKELEERLMFLKSEGRVDIAEKIRYARSFGDISENSEYDAAREEESALEQEIKEIEGKLRKAKIISKLKIDKSKVNIGCQVVVYDKIFDENLTFKIIGSSESNPSKGLISNISPIGKALMGKKKGDIVDVETPGASKMQFQVLSITY